MNIKKLPPDYYKILNLPFGSPGELIKKTYRDLAKIYHPDNKETGDKKRFQEINAAYRMLSGNIRNNYDLIYKKIFYIGKETITLPPARILYTGSLGDLAKKGLLKIGYRTKDRKKWTGVNHDLDILVKKSEREKTVIVKIPLTVRILCPSCLGSNIFCESCDGIGTYKSTRQLKLSFSPDLLIQDKIYELELSRFRPDRFIHFKKTRIKVKINIF
ncbi:MAG: DnaJ domain-containing protein [Leptospiraceae bacterium]|nr:DnaJ domain-containing protein [Leptospiraceae bacterium]